VGSGKWGVGSGKWEVGSEKDTEFVNYVGKVGQPNAWPLLSISLVLPASPTMTPGAACLPRAFQYTCISPPTRNRPRSGWYGGTGSSWSSALTELHDTSPKPRRLFLAPNFKIF